MTLDLSQTIDRMAARLYDHANDRRRLTHTASALLPACESLRRAAEDVEVSRGATGRTWAVRLAAVSCERRLHWLVETRDVRTRADLAQNLDAVVRLLAEALSVLEADPAPRRRGEA
jgi:hypothetical protein